MTASPSTASVASESGTRYLEDLFMHARGCSRRVTTSFETNVNAAIEDTTPSAEAALTVHENLVGDFLARVAPAAVDHLRRLEAAAPGFAMDIFNLKPAQVDALLRPIFEAAGVVDDFMPWQERLPEPEKLERA